MILKTAAKSSRVRHKVSLVTTSILLVALSGCTKLPHGTTPWQDDSPDKPASAAAKPGPTQVRTGGDGFALGDVEKATLSPQQFVDRVSEHLRSQHNLAARRFAERFPDTALAVFRDPTSVKASRDALLWIAEAHDRQCSRGDAPGWANVFRDRAAQPKRYANYDEKRRQFMTHVQNGRAHQALGLGLAAPQARAGPRAAVRRAAPYGNCADARQPAAGGRRRLSAGIEVGWRQPALRIRQRAIAVERCPAACRRRAGAERTWVTAAELCTDLTAGNAPVADPILMERAAYLRPASALAPHGQQRLNDLAARMGIVFPCPRSNRLRLCRRQRTTKPPCGQSSATGGWPARNRKRRWWPSSGPSR